MISRYREQPLNFCWKLFFCLLYFESYTRNSGSGNLTLRLVFTPLKGDRAQMKHTVVLVLSHSINPQSCVPIGESGFAVFPCQRRNPNRGLFFSTDRYVITILSYKELY